MKLSKEELKEIKEALGDVEAGRVSSIEEVAKRLGLKLSPK